MNILQLRISIGILLVIAIVLHKSIIPPYLLALMTMLEFLNARKEYRGNENHKTINAISFGIILIIFLNRIRYVHFEAEIEVPVNIMEHMMFSLLFCVVIWEVLNMKFMKPMKLMHRLLTINLVFFAIGTGNELYQYFAYSHAPGSLHALFLDSAKDIVVNCSSAVLFTLVVLSLNRPNLPFINQFIVNEEAN